MWYKFFQATSPREPFTMFADYEFPKAPNVWDTLEGKPQYQKCWAGKNWETDRDAVKIKAHRP